MKAIFKSIASYVPNTILSNKDLEKIVDTSDEWINKRTGIAERRIADASENTSDLAVKASLEAVARAGLSVADIDLVIVATITPDYYCMPSTACIVANKLGISGVAAFDISAACSGFVYALATAKAYIESGISKNALVIGAETLSRITDYQDRGTCILFGDGAGAAVISAGEGKGVLDVTLGSDGGFADFLQTKTKCDNSPFNVKPIAGEISFMQMKGSETFKVAVKTLSGDVQTILSRNDIKPDGIDFFVPHQANFRIISAVGEAINLPDEKLVLTLGKFGNTSAASIPMAIADIFNNDKLKNGDLLLLSAFGGGLTWGSALVYFNA